MRNKRRSGAQGLRRTRDKWIDPVVLVTLARKELRDAMRNRWFILYALCFAVLSMTLAQLALAGTGKYGFAGFGRTAASVINLVLLIVPLMALTVGAGSLAGERERGTLEAMLAQPVHRIEILLGKFIGLALALLGALVFGFGATAALLASRGASSNAASYSAICGLSVALSWAMLAVGFLISSLARKTSFSLGVAIFAWLGFVLLGDLGLMGGAMALRMSTSELLAVSLSNPLMVFKLFAVSCIHRSLDLLGPAGLYASQTYGRAMPAILGGILAAWTILPLLTASLIFSRRGVQ